MAVRPVNSFLMIQGVFALVTSLLLIVWPGQSAVVFSYLVGTWFIVDALLAFTAWLRFKSGTSMAHTLLSALLGILILVAPGVFLGFAVIALAAVALLFGAGVFFVSLILRSVGVRSWWVTMLLGVLAILAGFVMPVFPANTITIGIYLAAFLLAVYGIVSFMLARRLTTTFRTMRAQVRFDDNDTGPDVIKGEIVDD